MATLNPVTKIGRQHEKTWSRMQQRLSAMSFDYGSLMQENLLSFIKHKATSVSSCVGYFIPAILATVSFLLAKAKATILAMNHVQPTNLYFIFVGYPGTGKSAAVEHACIKPMQKIMEDEIKNCLLDRTTSSGLVKHLSKFGSGFIVSPEVYDVLNKLLKSDDETCSGDAMLMCKLFSGERVSFHYATEETREIDRNTPFTVLGSTQLPNAAKLLARMDKGQGLIDRFLISVPLALCPHSTDIKQSISYLETEAIDSFDELYCAILHFHKFNQVQYTLHEQAECLLNKERDTLTAEINEAIIAGEFSPPKSKKLDLLPRIATALHVLEKSLECVLAGHDIIIPSVISKETLEKAKLFVEHLESQKFVLCEVKIKILITNHLSVLNCRVKQTNNLTGFRFYFIFQFIKSITNDICDDERAQPSMMNVKSGILTFPGPLVTFRSFTQSGPRLARGISQHEFTNAVEQLKANYGQIITLRVARSSKPTLVFVKKAPNQFIEWPSDVLCSKYGFEENYRKPCHRSISQSIRQLISNQQLVSQEYLNLS